MQLKFQRAHSPPKRLWLSLGIPSRPRDDKESSEEESFLGRIQNYRLFTDLLFSLYRSSNAHMKIKTAVDLLTARFARALIDFWKKIGNDVCVQANRIKKRDRETCQLFIYSLFYLEFLNNNTDYGQASLETNSYTIPFVSKWVIHCFNSSSNYIFKLIHLNLTWAKTSKVCKQLFIIYNIIPSGLSTT